ncbi:MAG: hypothetical protein V1798_01105 [Pseudomonadota bacterium]
MNFEDQLKTLLAQVEGAQAAVLMGFDGIPVAEVKESEPSFPLADVMVECSRLLADAIKISEGNQLGALTEFLFSAGEYRIVLRVLNASYFVGLVLRSDANLGKGRYLLRKNSAELASSL